MMKQGTSNDGGRTLVVVLSMHRSGSSLTTQVLHRLGMSLGPFPLVGPLESNRHGHFEPEPINHLDMRLQQQVFGFAGDLPHSADVLQRLLSSDGRWEPGVPASAEDLQFGREIIRQLLQSGPVSGFKDPRVILLWPYWNEVLRGFPEIRIVLLMLVRSPHETAMSMFTRGKGQYAYCDALEVTAVNLQRLKEIGRNWGGRQVLVRFDPRFYPDDLREAAEACGLSWRDDVFEGLYHPGDRHYDPTRVDHRAQRLFDEFGGAAASGEDQHDALRLAKDSAIREKCIQSQTLRCLADVAQLQGASENSRIEAASLSQELAGLNQQLGRLDQQLARADQEVSGLAAGAYAEFQRFQALHDEQHRLIELLQRRLSALENHPLLRAARRIRRAYDRFRRQDTRHKAA